MAQPPAVVVRTLEPVGELQLHRLAKRIHFRCVRCRRDRTTSLVATTNGDWTQTVCGTCYGALFRAQREQAKKDKEAEKLKHRLPGILGLLAFFRAAGVDAEVAHGGRLMVNGRQAQPLEHLPPAETLEWKTIIDELALTCAGGKFIKAIESNARFGEGLRALLRQRERGFAIMRGDVRLAMIHATRAQILRREVIYANFLMPGRHWQQVADAMQGAEAELAAGVERGHEAMAAAEAVAAEAGRRRAAAPRPMHQLPNNLPPELIDACLNASRRIRLERQVVYDRPVVLEYDVGELTLLPIAGTGTRLLMPFRLNKGMETLKGELVLSDRDPLPLLIGGAVTDDDAATAWTHALLGFADATCIEFEPVEPSVRNEPARPRSRLSSPVSPHRPPMRTLPRKRPWPSHLEPVGHWIRYSGSFVAGHRRHLSDGQSASAEAHDRARQVGIILGPHETWVRPYARGVPDGIEMRFLWHPPTELKLFRTVPSGRGNGME